ncbi:hypothetical protein DsansV1_C18g0152661 [Dioscorea sansibarensis]
MVKNQFASLPKFQGDTYSIRFSPFQCLTSKIFISFSKSKLSPTIPSSEACWAALYLFSNRF